MANETMIKWVAINDTQFALAHGTFRGSSVSSALVEKTYDLCREHYIDGSTLELVKGMYYNRDGELLSIHYDVIHHASNHRVYVHSYPVFSSAFDKLATLSHKKVCHSIVRDFHRYGNCDLRIAHYDWLRQHGCSSLYDCGNFVMFQVISH